MTKLTKLQAEIITGYTGILCMSWSEFHGAAEAKLGRPVFTHEFGAPDTWAELKKAYRAQFLELCPE